MRRNPVRSSFHVLLSGLLLSACGGLSENERLLPEESLGTQESAMCSGASVSTLSIVNVDSYGGEVAGSGDWAVTYPANAVHLDFYVDGVLRATHELLSDTRSGSWSFSYNPVGCGPHTFEVKAYPMTIDSANNVYRCPTSGTLSNSRSFTQLCPSASLSCARTSSLSVTCTGSGSGGTGSLTPYWQKTGRSAYDSVDQVLSSWAPGSWQQSIRCPQTTDTFFVDRMTIEFKARDSSGMDSPVRTASLDCKAGSLPY